ncbi:MAG: N-acetyltransferase [Acutalibacteraceae bacterium]|nr:N-acetyltransferase [Acutalibacteraceae bacterium]
MSEKGFLGFKVVSLNELVVNLEEERVNSILSSFSSPLNKDVEYFLKNKAILFDSQSISRSHLVFASYRNKPVLVGYFTLAYKNFSIPLKNIGSKLRQRVKKFASYEEDMKVYRISAPLIAQLGKNYSDGYNKLITGDELLEIAIQLVSEVQMNIGGKIVYIECEDKPKLVEFYERNGFKQFSKRQLDIGDKKMMEGNYLLQLLRYL